MGTFVDYSEDEVRFWLEGMGFIEVFLDGVKELVFSRETNVPNLLILVYTSLQYGQTRERGKDAARVMLINAANNKMVWYAKRVHRTKNFLKNMRERCRDAYRAAGNVVKCPLCKNPMVLRENKKDGTEFYGCTDFPNCRGTRQID